MTQPFPFYVRNPVALTLLFRRIKKAPTSPRFFPEFNLAHGTMHYGQPSRKSILCYKDLIFNWNLNQEVTLPMSFCPFRVVFKIFTRQMRKWDLFTLCTKLYFSPGK